MDVVVCTERVSKRWGTVLALDQVTADVARGVTGLLGANGAGKTTLLGLILGLHRPDGGQLTVLGGDPVRAGPAVRARLGYAPEHGALPPEARAQDLVRHVAELHGLPRQAAVSRASETLDLVGLGEERLREIGTLSLGQQQRVKIAQTIVHDPALVLLDEPTSGLDPLQRDDMLATIDRIGHELGIPVIVASHLIHEVERICDAVVVLDGGRLAGAGDIQAMVTSGDDVLVEVDRDLEQLAAALARHGIATRAVTPTRLLATLRGEEDLDLVRDAVVDLDIGVHQLSRRTVTLEEQLFAAPSPGRSSPETPAPPPVPSPEPPS